MFGIELQQDVVTVSESTIRPAHGKKKKTELSGKVKSSAKSYAQAKRQQAAVNKKTGAAKKKVEKAKKADMRKRIHKGKKGDDRSSRG